MTDAPEKIWVHYEGETDDAVWTDDPCHDAVEDFLHFGEYIRSDIAQARIAELEAALAAKTLAELPAHMGMNDNDQPQEKETP